MAAREHKADSENNDAPKGDGGPSEAAQFVSESAAELAQLSRRHGLDVLAHLLEMAQMEADDIAARYIGNYSR